MCCTHPGTGEGGDAAAVARRQDVLPPHAQLHPKQLRVARDEFHPPWCLCCNLVPQLRVRGQVGDEGRSHDVAGASECQELGERHGRGDAPPLGTLQWARSRERRGGGGGEEGRRWRGKGLAPFLCAPTKQPPHVRQTPVRAALPAACAGGKASRCCCGGGQGTGGSARARRPVGAQQRISHLHRRSSTGGPGPLFPSCPILTGCFSCV